jgi:outer membrane protein assembly factor BamB
MAPLLLAVTWDQVTTQNEIWAMVLGAAVALTVDPERVLEDLPRITGGLTAMSISPHGGAALTRSINDYPFPIAATYVHKLGRPWAPEQAVQAQEAVLDMAAATVGYLAVVTACRYRKDVQVSGCADTAVEALLAGLREPGLADWAALLETVMKAPKPAGDPLRDDIIKFMESRREPGDAVFEAMGALRRWLGGSTQATPGLTNREFIDVLGGYCRATRARVAVGTRFGTQDDFQQRADVLRLAVDRLLLELAFLTSYPLVYVQEVRQAGRTWSHRVYDGMGRDLVVRSETLQSHKALDRFHVYLCRRDGSALQPTLDLDPLLVFQDCPTCSMPSMFFSSLGKTTRVEGVSLSCWHRAEWDDHQALANFLSLSEWQTNSLPAIFQPYRAALQEVMAENGKISPDQREKLSFLGKVLGVTREVAARLEEQVLSERQRKRDEAERAEQERRQAEEQERRQAEEARREAEAAARAAVLPATEPPLAPPEGKPKGCDLPARHLVQVWREGIAAPPTHLALTGVSSLAFVVDEAGTVCVRSRDGKVVYRDRVQGRACRMVPTADGVLVATWSGNVYAFGPDELKWHRALGSPVSVLLDRPVSKKLLAGTWNGRLVSLRSEDGTVEWTTLFEDGLSALAAGPDGSTTFVGSYGGHLARLGTDSAKQWVRDLRGGVLRLALADNAGDILVATRDGVLMQLQAETQTTVWEQFFEGGLIDVSFSGNGRRVALALRSGKVQSCVIDGGVDVRAQRDFEGLRSTFFSPLFSSGRFQFVLSQSQGLWLLDDHELAWTGEVEGPVSCAAISVDGRHVLVGGAADVQLYRLSAPALNVKLVPLAELRKGRFTRLRVTVDNTGERVARDIGVELTGPVEGRPFSLAQELRPGDRVVIENQSVQPKEDGALPLRVRIACIDDRRIPHLFESEQVLDTGAPSSVTQEGIS